MKNGGVWKLCTREKQQQNVYIYYSENYLKIPYNVSKAKEKSLFAKFEHLCLSGYCLQVSSCCACL